MEQEKNNKIRKVLLLKPCLTYAKSFVPGEPPGLEQYFPRVSTPTLDSFIYADNNDLLDRYELFRVWATLPPGKTEVLGLKNPPPQIFSGNLVLNVTEKKTIRNRYQNFKKTIKEFFIKIYYKCLRKSRCDDRICPVYCECQEVRNFLNKTIASDSSHDATDDDDEEEEIARLF